MQTYFFKKHKLHEIRQNILAIHAYVITSSPQPMEFSSIDDNSKVLLLQVQFNLTLEVQVQENNLNTLVT